MFSLSIVSASNVNDTDSGTNSHIEKTSDINNNIIESKTNETTVKANTSKYQILARDVQAHPNENTTFSGYVVDEKNNLVNEGQIAIKFNGKTHMKTRVVNGTFNINYLMPNYGVKNYTLQYVYGGNGVRSQLDKTLTLLKENVSFSSNNKSKSVNVRVLSSNAVVYAGCKAYFYGYVVDDVNYNPVNVGKVVIKFNGRTNATVNVSNGKFNYSTVMQFIKPKNYTLQYVFAKKGIYNRYELNKTMTVYKCPTGMEPIKVVADDVSAVAGKNVHLTGLIVDQDNNLISSGRFIVKINGKTQTSYNVTSGLFDFVFKVPGTLNGNYSLHFVYTSGNNYRYELVKTLTVSKSSVKVNSTSANSRIVASDVTAVSGKSVRFIGSIVNKNNQPFSNGTIVIKFNGKTQFKTNVTNGLFDFIFDLPKLSAKNYTLTYVFVNTKYQRSELVKTLRVVKD